MRFDLLELGGIDGLGIHCCWSHNCRLGRIEEGKEMRGVKKVRMLK